ncbi:MAG: phytanoyl-CoA dioxygenase family protein [Sphingomonas sp.]
MANFDLSAAKLDLAGLTKSLKDEGFVILENAVSAWTLDRARADLSPCFEAAPFCDGLFYGHTTKRFGRLLMRLRDRDAFALHPAIVALIQAVLDDTSIQLNLTQAIEIHPGAPVQTPHRDHDMWRCAKAPPTTLMVNVMWALDDFTGENGATRLWPGSNHGDWTDMSPAEKDARPAIAPAGSAIVFLGQTLHSGGANRSARPRRGMIFSYCRDWLLPDENPWLAYPPAIAATFSPALADLIGYRQRFAGLNNFEGRSPAELLRGDLPEFFQFADDMSPDQRALIEQYHASLIGSAAGSAEPPACQPPGMRGHAVGSG